MKERVSISWSPLEELVPADVLKSEVLTWAHRIGVTPKEVHVRPMKRKWASCSSLGRLTFSTDLLRQTAGFRAQVIVHELLHLKVPNHGPLFRALARAYLAATANPASSDGAARSSGSPVRRGPAKDAAAKAG